jgi:hypothetical protein
MKPFFDTKEIENTTDLEKKKKLKENLQELKSMLEWCPTFAGMERIMRYCLLNFLNKNSGIN